MCGFAALIDPGRSFDTALLNALDQDLFHRGPNAGGRLAEPSFALIHRRLSILDPREAADQPMIDPSGQYALVYNGEIYNYRAVRADLERAGATFRTQGDTEVLLAGYAHWGEAVFERLEGMYAFALLDRRQNTIVAARDPLGIKPLYLWSSGRQAMIASEVRPMRHLTTLEPDPDALAELINYRWAAGRLSNYANIARVPGGTVLSVSLADGRISERRFADPLDQLADDAGVTPERAETDARDALLASVKAHLASDVGYTVQLSGGVDSSFIAAATRGFADRPLQTFAVHISGYDEDEKPWRDALCDRYDFDHHEIALSGHDFADALPRALRHMEGPTPHLGCVMLMLLCDHIKTQGKVVLTGEGADEFFGGYFRYGHWRKTAWQERLGHLLPASWWPSRRPFAGIRRLAGLDAAAVGGVYHDIPALKRLFPGLPLRPGAREAASRRFRRFIDRLFAVDQSAYLESLLVRQDKMAMAASVEARVPFVHAPLARVLNRIPRRILAPGGGATKPLLKKIAEAYLPADLLHRRKVGLLLPIGEWLAEPQGLGRYLDDVTSPNSRLAAYAERGALRQAVDEFRAGARGADQIVMQLVNMETWLRTVPR
jgi:asparagine synthase (glutamine-hydrolysing)